MGRKAGSKDSYPRKPRADKGIPRVEKVSRNKGNPKLNVAANTGIVSRFWVEEGNHLYCDYKKGAKITRIYMLNGAIKKRQKECDK